jgi:predicted permease
MTILQDVRYGLRILRRSPGTAAAAALSLALGIGANSAIYSWVRGVLIEPLSGVSQQQDIVVVANRSRSGAWRTLSYPDYVDLRDTCKTLDGLVVDSIVTVSLGATAESRHAERVYGSLVSGNYFDVLRTGMSLGRGFTRAEDEAPGRAPVVVLSHGLWQRRFAGDAAIVGHTMPINGKPYTVVGVAPPDFYGVWSGLALDLWIPVMMQADVMQGDLIRARGSRWLQTLGRLAPGVTVEQAEAEVTAAVERLAQAWPSTNEGWTGAVVPMWRSPFGAQLFLTPVLLTLSGVVSLVLLLACANVANLLLARALGRRREMAIRLAVGGSRGRLVRQMLVESLMLAGLGGAGGILVAMAASPLLSRFNPPTDLMLRPAISMDGGVVAFTALLSVVTGIVFGLAPAFQSARADVIVALRDESAAGSRHRSRLRDALVVTQVALSAMLLVGAGLFLRSLVAAERLDPGFNPRDLMLAGYNLFPNGYTPETGAVFHERLVRQLQSEPGVQAAGVAVRLPLGFEGISSMTVSIDGYSRREDEDLNIQYNIVSPGYLAAMQIPVIAGRDFTFDDRIDTTHVMIVNRTMAERYWSGDPLGRIVRIGDTPYQVVGVVPTGKYQTLAEDPRPFFYVSIRQRYRPNAIIHVRSSESAGAALQRIRSVVSALDPNLPIFATKTGEQQMAFGTFANRIAASFLGLFGALALLLAGVGLYGVMAFAVAQRTREIGVRMALGARPADILRSVTSQGVRVALLGLAIGSAGALAVLPFASRLLVGVGPRDAATYVGVAAMLTLVAMLASGIPGLRAARLNPVDALRRS